MKKVASHALGCKVNQYESEAIAELFAKKGYEIVDWTYSTTKVRGCQYYIDEDFEIDEDAKVEVWHEPTEKYPENTVVYVDDEQVGTLKQDMATEWYLKFGKNYRFEGNVVEYEPGEYPYLLIEIKKPILRKIKKTAKNNNINENS